MKKYLLLLPLFLLVSCSEQNFESRELPTKYPETPTMGNAADAATGKLNP